MIKLNELSPKAGSKKKRTRLGMGLGSGKGKTCGRGTKGQMSRSGNTRKEAKEGGQTTLIRRIPKSGFSNARFSKKVESVNVSRLAKEFKADTNITLELLKEKNIVATIKRVKVLGHGKIEHALTVNAHSFSSGAKKAIETAGGKAVVIEIKQTPNMKLPKKKK
jgi:large subunit ribosomal protein L15